MGTGERELKKLGINPAYEVSNLLAHESYPEDYNPIVDFEQEVGNRKRFIELLKKQGLLKANLTGSTVVELGGGVCYTGAALAEQCKLVLAFELEKVHCLYAKRCKEYFNIDNLGIFHGSLIEIAGQRVYSLGDYAVDLVIAHMGMFKDTIIETLAKIGKMLKPKGKFICVYPRFWTHSDRLNSIDVQLLARASKDKKWNEFKAELQDKLARTGFEIEHSGLMEGYECIPIGGDVILGSNIASSREEYLSNPIEGIVFGRTLITCNTLVCYRR